MNRTRQPLGLSQLLTRQATWAIVALVLGFGLVTWFATGAHLVEASRSDAMQVAVDVLRPDPDPPLGHYIRREDPHIWIFGRHRERRSPNTHRAEAPSPGIVNFSTSPPMVVVSLTAQGSRVVVGWPMTSDLAVLRDLLVVVLVMGALSAAVAVWLTSWATRRMLAPVDHMTRLVANMVAARRVSPLPAWSHADDEFFRLTTVFNELLTQLNGQSLRERQMLAQAAHELRTPLQVLGGNLDLLARWGGLDPAVRQESLVQSRLVLDRLARLVQDLLMLERAQTGGEASEPVALLPILDTLLEDFRALAPDRPVDRTLEAVTVMASPWRVERALWVAADNALKYTPPATGIRVATVVSDDGRRAGVEVSDHGPGIPDAELPRVFERFFRGTDARGRDGTGLGLPIAKALVEHDGGTVEVLSQPGAGTTVRFLWRTASSTF